MRKWMMTTALVATGFAAPAQALDVSSMSDAERAAFGEAVRSYLMNNPEVIMEAVSQLEQRQAEAQAADDVALVAANMDALVNDGFSWVGGNPDGDITVVEFIDYRCGYCRRAHGEVAQLLNADGNIRLVVKELPILGEASLISSRIAVAVKQVAGSEAYKAVHDTLIAFSGDLSERAIRRMLEGLDLDAEAVMARMDSEDVAQEIAQTRALAQRLRINGTPTFVMGEQLVRGYVPLDAMREIVASERG